MASAKQNSSPFSILYLLLFAIMPLVYVKTVVDNTLIPRQLFSSVLIFVVATLIWRLKTRESIVPNTVLYLSFGFVLVNFISVFAAINPVESWAVASRLTVPFAYLVLTYFLLRSGRIQSSSIIKGIVLFGGITALITLVNIFQALGKGDFATDIYNVRATFGHKNLLSSALMLSFPVIVMGSIVLPEKNWRRASLVLAFLLVAEMFILRTRGVWLSMFVATAATLAAFLIVRNQNSENVRFPYKWVGIGAGLAVVILVALFSTKGFKDNIGDRTNLDRRMVFWNNSFEMIKEHPVLGVGAGNWKINFPKYGLSGDVKSGPKLDQSVYQGITHIQRPHNDYLWVWTEAGPVALLCFIGMFVVTLLRIFRNLKTSSDKNDLAIDLLSLFGLIAYMTFSLTDFPLERTSHGLLSMTFIALAYRAKLSENTKGIPVTPVSLALIGLMLFSVVVCYNRWQGEIHTVAVLEANSKRDARAIIPAAEDAVNSFYNMDLYANPLPYYSSLGKLTMQNTSGAMEDALYAYDIHPYNIIVLNQLGNVYKVMKNNDEALKYYHQAVEISPWFETARLNLAEVYMIQNKPVEAFDALAIVSRNSRNPKYLQLLSQVLPEVVRTYPTHKRFQPMVEYLQQRNPKNREEYVQYFLQFRLSPSNG